MNKPLGFTQKISTLLGAILAGGLTSACCIGPFVIVLLGTGSVSAFVVFEAFRPLFAIITFGLLVWAGWQHWKSRKICAAQGCPPPKLTLFWLLGLIAITLLFFPLLLALLLQLGQKI